MADIDTRGLDRELKKGAGELLILSLLEARARHGYDLSKLIQSRSRGQLTFHIDSLYPYLALRQAESEFGRFADVVGRTVQANGGTYEVIGILPPSANDHRLFGRVGLFSPLSFNDAARTDRTTHTITVLGRRGPGVSDPLRRTGPATVPC